ncbi:hypothetical protein BC830DRAFT_1173208 [Chytriomyces sp. MP71]|nr:hypothetical protein BC830DRAFT_1173208 [Chytriomyces sp. MP71]
MTSPTHAEMATSTDAGFPFPISLNLMDASRLRDNLGGPLEMASLRQVQSCIETAVGVLYNAATPLESWHAYRHEYERTRNKYETEAWGSEGGSKVEDFRWGEQSNEYQQVLQSAMEYVALFRVNRPVQSEYSSVLDIRHVEDVFMELLEETYDIMMTAKNEFNGNVAESLQSLSQTLHKKANQELNAFNEKLTKMQCAYRSRLLDTLAKVSFICKKLMDKMEKDILKMKKDTYDRENEIGKLKVQMKKYSKLMKKYNIAAPEDYLVVDDEKIKADSILQHYQSIIYTREQKLKSMKTQLKDLEGILAHQSWPGSSEGGRPRSNSMAPVTRHKSVHNTPPSKPPTAATPGSSLRKMGESKQAPELQDLEDMKAWITRSCPTAIGRIGTDEAFGILEEVRGEYEAKVAAMREEYVAKIVAERTEIVRVQREFQKQYDEIVRELTSSYDFLNLLWEKQGCIVSRVENMYPIHVKHGMTNAEVQCDLDEPPASKATSIENGTRRSTIRFMNSVTAGESASASVLHSGTAKARKRYAEPARDCTRYNLVGPVARTGNARPSILQSRSSVTSLMTGWTDSRWDARASALGSAADHNAVLLVVPLLASLSCSSSTSFLQSKPTSLMQMP